MQKKIVIVALFVTGLLFATSCASSRKMNRDTEQFRYELEGVSTGSQNSYQVKVWSYSRSSNLAIEQAKKNAVHGIIFKGFPDNGRVKGQRPLASNPNLEQEKAEFFQEFFKDGGKYQKYVTLSNNGSIAAGDRMRIGSEYKIGVIVNVNVTSLRKDLEAAGVIKGLTGGF